ncbi:helix-turn-helix transcriptional regulator [Paraburkholderia nemoris]|uniref:helix-turn-helix domain-containing protein n=1 Tax=Paraburkholderia nemoris TaxID=2793076 RepID=UPI0038BD1258
MNRTAYIGDEYVKGFIAYLSDVISGAVSIELSVGFSKTQLYDGFEDKFEGCDDDRDGGGPVYVVFARTLADLFRMYWWDRKDYNENKVALDVASAAITAAIDGENRENGRELAENACHVVMKWGFGHGRRPYKANMSWAKRQKESLVHVLRDGRESLSGENPNIDAFGMGFDGEIGTPKMNAGWTKYYALALPNHIIYDGRVGAALGFLVRRYLKNLPRHNRPGSVPEELAFPWANGVGGGKLRDPSSGEYQFSKLYGGRYGSKQWARVNVRANWVLSEARDKARADWCAGPEGLRKLEAALFMLGYDLSLADYADSAGRTTGLPPTLDTTGSPSSKARASVSTQTKSKFYAGISESSSSSCVIEASKRLPTVTDANFRAALKEARLAAGLSYSELARRAGIHEVMPSRYENAEHSNATTPSEKTWEKLNEVLFPFAPPS